MRGRDSRRKLVGRKYFFSKNFGWEAGIRTPISGVRVRCPTVERPPSRVGTTHYIEPLPRETSAGKLVLRRHHGRLLHWNLRHRRPGAIQEVSTARDGPSPEVRRRGAG